MGEMLDKCPIAETTSYGMEHTNMLFYDQHILKLPDVVKLKTAIIMCKAFHNLLPVNVQQFFSIYESAYTTRHNCNFKHYDSRTTLKGMCISIIYRGKTVELT